MTGLWLLSYIALWLLLLVVAVALLAVLRNLGVLYESLSASRTAGTGDTKLVAGEVLPSLSLRTLTGDPSDLSTFQGTKTAISVVSPRCAPCHELLRDIAAGRAVTDPLDPAVRRRLIISVGDLRTSADLARQIRLPQDIPVLVDTTDNIAERWGVTTTPTTVIVDERMRMVRYLWGAPGTSVGGGTAEFGGAVSGSEHSELNKTRLYPAERSATHGIPTTTR